MSLPDYDQKELYSESDIEHIVARRMAKIQLEQLQTSQIELRKEMMAEIAEIKTSVKELVNAWNSAGTMVRFVKYVAGFVTACIVIAAVFKEWITK